MNGTQSEFKSADGYETGPPLVETTWTSRNTILLVLHIFIASNDVQLLMEVFLHLAKNFWSKFGPFRPTLGPKKGFRSISRL